MNRGASAVCAAFLLVACGSRASSSAADVVSVRVDLYDVADGVPMHGADCGGEGASVEVAGGRSVEGTFTFLDGDGNVLATVELEDGGIVPYEGHCVPHATPFAVQLPKADVYRIQGPTVADNKRPPTITASQLEAAGNLWEAEIGG